MKIKENINENIFRGYDIRGIYPTEIDEDTVYTIGLGFGSYIKSLGKTTCVIGFDNRISSPSLHNALVSGIIKTGINIISLGECTTPMYYYACIKLGIYSGIMITASHNPKDDNGLKFAFDERGNCKGQEIIVDGINTGMYVAIEDYYRWLENVINEDMFKDKS